MSTFTNEEYADMHLVYGEAKGNGRAAARLYAERYPQRRQPSPKVFQSVHQRLRDYGAFRNHHHGGANRNARTPKFEEDVDDDEQPYDHQQIHAKDSSDSATKRRKMSHFYLNEHLSTGSKQPPKVDGLLRLYSTEVCPFSQPVQLVLQAKNIPHEIIYIDLRNKPEWYFKISPEGIIPALDAGSEIVVESLRICDFLDEKYPEIPLYPSDAELKKRDQDLIQKIEPLRELFHRTILKKVIKTPKEWTKEFAPHLELFQSELSSRGSTYFGGNDPGMVDYMIWPWCQRGKVISLALGENLPFDQDHLLVMRKWYKDMRQNAACCATYTEPEGYWKITQAIL